MHGTNKGKLRLGRWE